MRKQLIPLIITLIFFIGNNCFAQGFGGGSGNSASDPYLISTKDHLIELANRVNGNGYTVNNFSGKYFKMMNDIDMSVSGTFNPIGNANNRTFRGNFNGNGKVIRNCTISSGTYVGLFGNISGATIDSLGIEGFSITTANGSAGALVGSANNSEINGCYSANSTISGSREWFYIPYIGGLIGYLDGASKINNSYSRSTVKALSGDFLYTSYVGGLVAYIAGGSTISNSYSAPLSLGSRGTRGAFFANGSVTTVNSYYDNANTNINNAGLTSKSQAEMCSGCFAATLNNAQNPIVWFKAKSQVNDGYPVLSWQKLSNNLPAGFEGNCLGVTYDGGTQTTQYEIRYVKDLIYISNMVRNDTNYYNKYFQFQNNISFTDSSIYYNPIGDSNSNCFSGNIDGNGKIISNLTISKNDSVGLFGCISGATIQSLGIANRCSFTSRVYGGSLAGYASNSTIDKCFSMASLTGNATNSKIGGLIGYINGTSINNCYTINSITNSSSQSFSGGLVCLMDNNSTISNSYSSPSSFPTNGTRGILVGSITNCSNPSSNSYYDSTLNVSGMTILGISQTISQMITLDFAMDLNACQTNVWEWANGNTSLNNGLPMFNWENIGTVLPLCGSSAYPFRIRCVADLITLSNNVAGGTDYLNQFLLVENDIDFNNDPTGNSSGFTPIGNTTKSFRGNFNGGGHVISNLTKNSGNYLGLFGYISGATISNLGIEGGSLTTSQYGGALVAYAVNSVIQECYSALTTIQPSSNNLTYGGLVGYSSGCQILNCYSRTRLSSSNNNPTGAGGLVGRITNFSSVSNSYASPLQALSGNGTRGLLVGNNRNTNNSINSTITNSYFDNTLSANGYNGLGTAKTSPKMKTGCFPTYLNNGQDPIIWFKAKSQSVSGITGGVNQGYPVLSWQKLSDGITPAGFEGNCLGYDTTFVGSSSSPYRVRYVKDLIYISNMVANDTTYNENGEKKFFQMQNDISFIKYNNVSSVLVDSSSLYKPIGDFSNNKPFSGNFNGLRNAIANYSFLDTTNNNIGFFGYTNLATIQRLGISNINICAKDTVGGLVANADSTKIGGCFVYGFIKGKNNVGGLVGVGTGATSAIDTSFTNTSIDAQTNVGGLVGNHNGGTINNSYSNSEIYSSTNANNYVGGIIGLAAATPTLNKVYSTCKIIRNGTNTNFGKIIGNNIGNNTNCYSRDSVFVNYTNANLTGYTAYSNDTLRSATFATSTLGSANWKADNDSINDGYPILKYQPQAVKPNSSGLWPTTTASQVVIIKSNVQLKANTANFPKCAYVKIEAGGELNNTTNINVFGEYNRELYVGKWNLIGLSTYNRILSCLYNYTDSISFKTFVKRFNYTSNNWSTTTTQDINTQFNFGEGILVMPNYSLDARLIIKSRIVAKGVLFNDTTLSYTFNNTSTATNKFVSLANNYPASLDTALLINNNSSLIQGRLIYVYDADSGKWNNNLSSNVRVTSLKPSEGFFIGSASGIFNFKKSQIRNTSGAKNFIKSDLIYVQAIADSNVRESFLEFNEEADNGFDFEDGLMLFGNNYNSVEPFFTIPTPEINDSTIQLIKDAFSSLPYTTELDLRSQKTNEVSINFSNIPSNIHVYLLDSLLNKAQYLNEEPYYNLQVNEGDNVKRLYVLFSYYKEDINEFFKPEVAQEIKIWNYNNNLNIEGRDLIRYELFDIMGNKLLVEDILDDKFKTQLDLGSGIYIVRAFSSSSSKAQKISISRK